MLRRTLRRHLGHDVPYFSFPWGYPKNMSSTALAIASETYPYLFAAYGGVNEVRNGASPVFKRPPCRKACSSWSFPCRGSWISEGTKMVFDPHRDGDGSRREFWSDATN